MPLSRSRYAANPGLARDRNGLDRRLGEKAEDFLTACDFRRGSDARECIDMDGCAQRHALIRVGIASASASPTGGNVGNVVLDARDMTKISCGTIIGLSTRRTTQPQDFNLAPPDRALVQLYGGHALSAWHWRVLRIEQRCRSAANQQTGRGRCCNASSSCTTDPRMDRLEKLAPNCAHDASSGCPVPVGFLVTAAVRRTTGCVAGVRDQKHASSSRGSDWL